MTVRIPRHLLTGALAVAVFYGLLGTEVQCTTAEARPSLARLQAQIDELRSQQLHVFDATGVDVGLLMSGVGEYTTYLPDLDLIVILKVNNGEQQTTAPALIEVLRYTMPDCSGQAFLPAGNGIPVRALFHPGLEVWVIVEAGTTSEIIDLQSVSGHSGIGDPTCEDTQGSGTFVPVTFLAPDIFDYLDDLVPPLYVAPAGAP